MMHKIVCIYEYIFNFYSKCMGGHKCRFFLTLSMLTSKMFSSDVSVAAVFLQGNCCTKYLRNKYRVYTSILLFRFGLTGHEAFCVAIHLLCGTVSGGC